MARAGRATALIGVALPLLLIGHSKFAAFEVDALKPLTAAKEPFVAEYAKRAIANIEGKPYTRYAPTQETWEKDLWSLPKGMKMVVQMTMPPTGTLDWEKALAAFKPGPEDWSVLELMSHVVSTKRIVALLAAALAEGKLPPGINADSELESRQDGVTIMHFETLASARETASTAHADMLKFIRSIDDSTNTELRFKHFVFGAFNSPE